MRQTKNIQKLSNAELSGQGLSSSSSWHDQYRDSSFIYVGGLPYELNEGDICTVFSQYGEVTEVNLIRDQETGKSRGFAFLKYLDQRSTILAVDNLNGIMLGQRTLQVDHVQKYRSPEELKLEREARQKGKAHGGKYASLVTEDIFRTALGEYLAKPETLSAVELPAYKTGNSDTEESHKDVTKKRPIKRPRTEAERELRKRFKRGDISAQEYEAAKDLLKKDLRGRP